MENTQITKCPKCDSTFKVTPAQLNVAKGAVRCGACLHVFRARDYFQGKKVKPDTQDDRTQDMFTESLFETPAEESSLLADDDQLFEDDGLIHDDMDSDTLSMDDASTSFSSDLNQDFLSIDGDSVDDPFFSDSDKIIDSVESDTGDDESWAQALIDDSEDESHTPKAQPKKEPPKTAQPAFNNLKQQAFSYIEVDPLDLSLPEKRSKVKLWLGLSASILMLSTLSIQLAYFNFNEWARKDNLRPWYEMACQQLECTLPSAYDITKIRTTASPRVSSHSKYQDALTVDVLFMNHATHEQAFPRLELTFTDINERPIAHRLFTPSEYLAGEAAGLSLMPVQTPIHIALEIQDPGPSANNYRVRFLSPQ